MYVCMYACMYVLYVKGMQMYVCGVSLTHKVVYMYFMCMYVYCI